MQSYNISQLKSHLSQAIGMVKEGSTVLVLDRETPVARIEPVENDSEALKIRLPLKKEIAGTFYAGVDIDADIQKILEEDRKSR